MGCHPHAHSAAAPPFGDAGGDNASLLDLQAKQIEKQVADAEKIEAEETIARPTTQFETLLLEKHAKFDNSLARARELLTQPQVEYAHLTPDSRQLVAEENTTHLQHVNSQYAAFAAKVAGLKD